ncbi:MAG: phenylalanine--tRNA ligase subunit beta [Oscillospiraceae bacterium]|nr:phenylalanine--tRNA ligase subunit beta [Oscillospiraceae bacterium]
MDLSMRWLGDYVDVPEMSDRDFAEALTMSGSKVEKWEHEGEEIENVVVGRILSLDQHPNADSLLICSVDIGREAPVQILTGAKNLKVGDLVPAALDGAKLPGGKEIHTTNMRGELSEGMLCSLAELNLTINDFPYAVENGIFVIEEEGVVPGMNACEAVGLNDTVVEFEITSNRPDCMSVTGLARETAATFDVPLKLEAPKIEKEVGDINDMLSVEVKNPVLCPRYVARAVTNVKIGPSPRWMRERLRASGVRPINNIVDITNYVMLEYGQPMHAFDINCVKGHKIVVRNAEEGESILTLDGTERKLSTEMLVIADAEKPSAVAGVMGGENSGIHDDTVTVVFESANFHGSSVRITAKKLGMRTEASGRFEKGLDPEICPMAADRACQLVEMLGAGEVVGGFIDVNNAKKEPVVVKFEPEWTNEFLGIELSRDEMVNILQKVGFAVNGNDITVPSFRTDVFHKADIAEEIARFYGYNKIPSTRLSNSVYGSVTETQSLERLAVRTLIAQGMYEICTYTFVSPKVFDKIRLPEDSPLRRTVNILNPLGEDTSVMRTSIYPSMLEVLARNYNNRNASAALFEIAKEYIPNESVNDLPDENPMIALGMYGAGCDYYTIKGVLETLFTAFGVSDYDVEAVKDNPVFHPGRCANVTKDGVLLATIGEVHPLVLQNYEIGTRAYLGRVDFKALCAASTVGSRLYHALPRFPASTRDIALLCDDALPVLTIENAIKSAVGEILESVELFDHYKGAQIPEGKKSLAFALSMRAADRTLTDAEVSAAMDRALEAVVSLGAQLRA